MSSVSPVPLVYCAPPPSERAPTLLPQVAPRPPTRPPVSAPRSGLRTPVQAPVDRAPCKPSSGATPSTATSTAAVRSPSESTAASDDERDASPDARLGRAVRGVGSSLASALRVRNTFLEFPPELHLEEDGCRSARRSARSCPPPGRATPPRPWASEDSNGNEDTVDCPPDVPTVGSSLHASGKCKPCAFVHTKGCSSGRSCTFCHLCDADEKKRRQKDRWEEKRRVWRAWRKQERRQAARRRPGEPAAALEAAPPTEGVSC